MKVKVIIEFKSKPEFYSKEEQGFKSNTVRRVKQDDRRFNFLANWVEGANTYIKIMNTKNKRYFERRITDVTIFENLFIISWKHPEAKQ